MGPARIILEGDEASNARARIQQGLESRAAPYGNHCRICRRVSPRGSRLRASLALEAHPHHTQTTAPNSAASSPSSSSRPGTSTVEPATPVPRTRKLSGSLAGHSHGATGAQAKRVVVDPKLEVEVVLVKVELVLLVLPRPPTSPPEHAEPPSQFAGCTKTPVSSAATIAAAPVDPAIMLGLVA